MLDAPSEKEVSTEIEFIEKRVNKLLKTDVANSAA